MASSSGEKFKLPCKYGNIGNSVWNEFTQLAIEYKPVHLAQGFPDFPAPKHVTKTLEDVANEDALLHQYTRGFGHPRLVDALSKLYSKLIGRKIDAFSEILITCGAYEALFSCIGGHTKPGDEFIIIEPFFDSYEPTVTAAGGKPIFIPLRPKPNTASNGPTTSADWVLDPDELASKFNSKTKAIILNSPLNPIGKVFTVEELTTIADLCKKWNTLCISDEVYEWITYKPSKHVRMAALPGMWERTLTIGTAGKTFGVTGWKVGWTYGPANLMENLRIVHQNCVSSCPTPLQEAVARCLVHEMTRMDSPDCVFKRNAAIYEPKRDFLVNTLTQIGMKPIIPEGGYFIVADWSSLENAVDLSKETDQYKDFRFAKYLTKNVGLLGIPTSAFYNEPNKPLASTLIRFCFVKKEETLQKAAKILQDWRTQK